MTTYFLYIFLQNDYYEYRKKEIQMYLTSKKFIASHYYNLLIFYKRNAAVLLTQCQEYKMGEK